MSGINMNELADACRGMEGASLTIGARIDDELSDVVRETMRLPQFRDGAKASDLSIAIFGDAGNSHVLAVDKRLLLMRDAGMATWERGMFRLLDNVMTFGPSDACVRRIWGVLSGLLTGCEYDRSITGGFVMSEAVEVGGFRFLIEYYIDDSEEELVAEEAIDWEEHVWRVVIGPVEGE